MTLRQNLNDYPEWVIYNQEYVDGPGWAGNFLIRNNFGMFAPWVVAHARAGIREAVPTQADAVDWVVKQEDEAKWDIARDLEDRISDAAERVQEEYDCDSDLSELAKHRAYHWVSYAVVRGVHPDVSFKE